MPVKSYEVIPMSFRKTLAQAVCHVRADTGTVLLEFYVVHEGLQHRASHSLQRCRFKNSSDRSSAAFAESG